jgi:hypothetical protein
MVILVATRIQNNFSLGGSVVTLVTLDPWWIGHLRVVEDEGQIN